ncbi:MAG: hydroxymethylglutaryl-CoA lyase, partial [Chloroflexota bacterium]
DESLAAFAPVLLRATQLGWWRRAYVSTAFGCPFTGQVDVAKVVDVALRLDDLGVDEICIGDTIGVGVPSQVHEISAALIAGGIAIDTIAYHFHDTRGTALANVMAGLEDGISCFDASTGGTGGCPYAPGAAGNLATEDLVYLLDGLGIAHGVDLTRVIEAARFIAAALGKPLASKVGQAGGWDAATGQRLLPGA